MTPLQNRVSTSFFKTYCPDPTVMYDFPELYQEFNQKFFDGDMPNLPLNPYKDKDGDLAFWTPAIKWSGRMTRTYGVFQPMSKYSCGGRITISKRLAPDPVAMKSTFIHEMIHMYLSYHGMDDGIKGHGPNFIKQAIRINRKLKELNLPYRINFYDREVTVDRPHVEAEIIKGEFTCGEEPDLDLGLKVQSHARHAFHTSFTYVQ